MASFFANDFTKTEWKKAALKNAFVLLGKQRFVHAAAFFLLADSLTDAVQVGVNQLVNQSNADVGRARGRFAIGARRHASF